MDFSQDRITTLHDLCIDKKFLIKCIEDMSVERPVALVLPLLYEELSGDALRNIVESLNKLNYLNEVIIPISARNREEYQESLNYFSILKHNTLVVWCNGPGVTYNLRELKEKGIDLTLLYGKGMDVWIAMGIGSLENYAMILHDGDILTYDEMLPSKLIFPIIEPELDFYFNKGYYARIDLNERTMYGRVYRLFVKPLLNSFLDVVGYDSRFLQYMCSFRYPLAGDFALTSDLALNMRIPADWGLEIGILAEVYRNTAIKRVCQTDLGIYDHKHREIGKDRTEGLQKMANDILLTLLRNLTEIKGIQISKDFLISLGVLYRRHAQDLVRQYHAESMFNKINYNRHLEETTVDLFAKIIVTSGAEYLNEPTGTQIPDWLRVLSAIPTIRKDLKESVIEEMERFSK